MLIHSMLIERVDNIFWIAPCHIFSLANLEGQSVEHSYKLPVRSRDEQACRQCATSMWREYVVHRCDGFNEGLESGDQQKTDLS